MISNAKKALQKLYTLCISGYCWSEFDQFLYTCPAARDTIDYEGIVDAAEKAEAKWTREAKGKKSAVPQLPTINLWGMKKP